MILRVKKFFGFFGHGKFGPDLNEFFGALGRPPPYIYIYIYISPVVENGHQADIFAHFCHHNIMISGGTGTAPYEFL